MMIAAIREGNVTGKAFNGFDQGVRGRTCIKALCGIDKRMFKFCSIVIS